MGAKKNPFYRIVVADSKKKRDGRFLEIIGTVDPLKKPTQLTIKEDRLKDWLEKGAKPSVTVSNLLKREGIPAKTS